MTNFKQAKKLVARGLAVSMAFGSAGMVVGCAPGYERVDFNEGLKRDVLRDPATGDAILDKNGQPVYGHFKPSGVYTEAHPGDGSKTMCDASQCWEKDTKTGAWIKTALNTVNTLTGVGSVLVNAALVRAENRASSSASAAAAEGVHVDIQSGISSGYVASGPGSSASRPGLAIGRQITEFGAVSGAAQIQVNQSALTAVAAPGGPQ